jgi:hypothetical protein
MQPDLELETPEARRIWKDFLRRLDRSNRALSEQEREEARAEAIAHIAELLAEETGDDEADRLRKALARFGLPPALPPLWRKPLAHMLHYFAIMVMGAGGLVVLALLHMAVMEVFNPAGVGLYLYPGDAGITLSYENQAGARELLGGWFIPAILSVSLLAVGGLFGLWRLALCPSGPISRWMRS